MIASSAGRGDYAERTARTGELVQQLHTIVSELERLHPGRKFTPDGHLVGSLGEAAGEAMFDLVLRPSSTRGHDAIAVDGRTVEIKATYGAGQVAIRPTSHEHAQALIVLRLSADPDVPPEVVFNGPFACAAEHAGRVQSNGQAPIRLSKLREANRDVEDGDRVPRRAEGVLLPRA